MVAAAILGAGALSAGAGIWGANTAANAQTNASTASIANQQQMFGQIKNLLQPFISGGTDALGKLTNFTDPNAEGSPLNSLLKLVTPGADMSSTLQQTPGYQFAENQGLRAVNNQLAARGLGGSAGAVAKGAGQFVTGLASNTWSNVVNALQNAFSTGSGALQNIVNSGVTAGGNISGAGQNTGNQISSALTGAGNAQAAAANATGSAISGLGNSVSTAALINQLTGKAGGGLYNNGGLATTMNYGGQTWPAYS